MINQTRRITEGSLMCALLGVLLVINRQLLGVFTPFLIIIMPIPIILYTVRYGLKNALLVAFSVLMISLLLSSLPAIIMVTMSLFLGLIYGDGINRNQSSFIILLKSILITMALEFMIGYFMAGLFGVDLIKETQTILEVIRPYFDVSAQLLNRIAFSVWIGSIVLVAINETIIVHLLSLILLKRLRIKERKVRSIFDLSIPKQWAILEAIVCLIAIFITFSPINDTLKVLILFVGYFSVIHLFSFGFIACIWLGHLYLNKNITLYLALGTIMVIPIAIPCMTVLGLVYNIIDFKRITKEVKNG